ncbi:MAG: hypothetical protein ABL903_11995 [Methylococcales bacterium]
MRYHLQITVMFLLIISTPLVLTLINHNSSILKNENRVSAPVPEIPKSWDQWPDFSSQLERYVNDHFGLRPVFLWLYHQLKNAINDSSSKSVIQGKNGWLFYDMEIDTYRHITKYTEEQLNQFAEVIEYRRNWLKQRGIDYIMVIPPNKSSIYPEYVPDYLTIIQPESALDQLLAYAKQHVKVPILDLRASLKKAKSQAWVYYKYDTHWNEFGGNIAQYQIAQYLAAMYPNKIQPHLFAATDYRFSKEQESDLSNMSYKKPDNTNSWAGIKPESLINFCENALKHYEKNKPISIHCPNKSINALVFRDSFFDFLMPHIANYFYDSTYIEGELNLNIIDGILKDKSINIVIEEMVERKLPYLPKLHVNVAEEYAQLAPVFNKKAKSVFKLLPATSNLQNTELQTFTWEANKLILHVNTTDPSLNLSFKPDAGKGYYLMKISIESPEITEMQVFYSQQPAAQKFTEQNSSRRLLSKGINTLIFPFAIENFGGEIRVDPGNVRGRYIINSLEIRALANGALQ